MIAYLLAQTIAITGGTVYPVSGPKVEHATVLIQNGRIAAVGTNVTIPADATRIDAAGKWVTPGFVDGGTQMGLVEIGAVPGTREAFVQNDTIAASFNVAEGINPASTLIPVTRIEGITTVLAAPQGHLVSGQAVLIDLDGATIEQMLVRSPVGIVANFDENAKGEGGGPRGPAPGVARAAAPHRGGKPSQRHRNGAAHRAGVPAETDPGRRAGGLGDRGRDRPRRGAGARRAPRQHPDLRRPRRALRECGGARPGRGEGGP